jgi:hypothetical protein
MDEFLEKNIPLININPNDLDYISSNIRYNIFFKLDFIYKAKTVYHNSNYSGMGWITTFINRIKLC